jgi:hypothetical protein
MSDSEVEQLLEFENPESFKSKIFVCHKIKVLGSRKSLFVSQKIRVLGSTSFNHVESNLVGHFVCNSKLTRV